MWKEYKISRDYSGVEYEYIGRFWGNILTTIRMSIGDNDFGGIIHLNQYRTMVFWLIWVSIVFITCIIFLNFIIAEASASYERVSDNIDNFLLYQKVCLISESEDMLPKTYLKNKDKFPKYLIIREMEQ